jgi:hypothetical protein
VKKLLVPLGFLLFIIFLFSASSIEAAKPKPGNANTYTQSEIQLKYDMQEAWIEHAWWTRSFIVSSIAGLEDQEEVLNRLLQNQVDIGNLIKPYYGEKAGNKLTDLLKEHIVIAGKIVESAKKADQANIDKFNKEWTRNADEIINFLANANPNWSKEQLQEMFYLHLQLTTDEVVARLHKDWVTDIQKADQNEEHLIHMADFLTDGIVKQFPDKFK